MTTFTPTNTGARFTDTDGDVSFTATPELARFTAGYQSVTSGASALDDLSDVTLTSPSNGQVLKYNGSAWVNGTDATGSGGSGNIAVQGVLPADLDVSGGTFTTLDRLGVDGVTVITADVPRAFVVGVTGIILSGANAGVWTITASGPCTQTEVLGGQIVVAQESATMAAAFIGTNTDGPNGAVDITEPATAFTLSPAAWAALIGTPSTFPSDWSTLSNKPARITSLESFVRPTVIFSRFHDGGEPAYPGGSTLANWCNPATGEILAPIYNVTNFPTKLPLYDENGNVVSEWDYDDRPVIDGYPWQGGTILLRNQANWEANGPWDIYDDGGTWKVQRPTLLNGWVTDAMVVEGMPFWIGSGVNHRLKTGAYFHNNIVPTDSGHTYGFHRNEAAETYYDPAADADWDTPPTRVSPALDELADRVTTAEGLYIPDTIVDAKGDLIVATGADTVTRLPVGGTNGHVLTVDSAEAAGVKWAAASGGGSSPLLDTLGAQTPISESATDFATLGVNAVLLDTAYSLPASAAGDVIEFVATVTYNNQSGATRQPRGGFRLGSTNCVSSEAISLGNAPTGVTSNFVIRGTIHVLTTSSQRLICGFNTDRLTGSFGNHTAATEDFTGALNLQITFGTNNASGTQTTTLTSLHITKVTA